MVLVVVEKHSSITLCAASSGIASLLLIGGCTAHSHFEISLQLFENSTCGMSNGTLAQIIQAANAIIWDEVSMQHCHAPEVADCTLCDVCDINCPFGGITVIFGGDCQQILPAIIKGICAQIVGACICSSALWQDIAPNIFHLH
ncbi:hypothetical protein PAXRUDRAFT_179658 [Paxillus rubicundulus Ve08.2h10]|uniref:ATP-dependent DNA helicase n=1 Tax=Paxillus rubicundulus Ve08.2h10 TaxID=930991 RepID=A0A0D0CQ18_9AGAM|nr:hypothetical protein PAXRUDRAFT_179658 [Paxillus rubicundulus Ve08.2h10]